MDPMILLRIENDTAFGPETPVSAPVAGPAALTRTAGDTQVSPQGSHMGIWECSPGKFKRMVPQAEYSHILSGFGSFTPEGGETMHFRAGDMVYFQANVQGVWEITETLRKAYLIIH